MDLLEHQGKALLARHGLAVPEGGLWPDLPKVEGPLVVKAQVAAGNRGKAGGIRVAAGIEEAVQQAKELLGSRVACRRVDAVYIERRLPIEREVYLAVAVDRDERRHVVLASPDGGIDVEQADSARLLRLPVDPWLGLRPFHCAHVARFLSDDSETRPRLARAVEALYRVAVEEDAELAEVNPLAVLADGEVVAADAKVRLDDNAGFRHPERGRLAAPTSDSPLEQAIAAAGAVGIEVDPEGDVAAIVSGAGLMMATLDLLIDAGARVRCVIDLGGTVLAGGQKLQRVFQAAARANPKVTLLNAFLQTALCDEFARALVAAHTIAPLHGRVVIRLKGRRAEEGREILAPQGFEAHEDLSSAIAAARGGSATG